ncbi:Transcriptional regulator, LacI family [uncultured Pleomorphomonas sp.]|uniref:Transcriptional regulator, LacI family n=1 Tax=uncultured Pleomorphomonas sp. TaxID=442121 RepID=A0A212L1J0_9HYPH|nr:LacI family DNA-binding transcriptional regulator [uncultured Pleomorphomonas sp.]SCM71402.1 Transcriptional regulator, LacI family [uncultured Pleomorphomonas sp.]
MKQPTIRDVAVFAGVSPASVSRFLNNKTVLPPDMAATIDRAVKTLGYRPNVLARRLSLGTTETIGFVTADIAAPFFAEVASAAEQEAERHGFSLMICNTRNEVARELEYLRRQREGHFDGVIFMTNHRDDGRLREAVRATPNVVLLDEDVPGTDGPKFFIDNVDAGYIATRHLIEAGHRIIGHVTGMHGMISVDERLIGYRKALEEAGIPYRDDLVMAGSYDAAFGSEAFDALWDGPTRPTAICSSSDILALSIYAAAKRRDLRIPQDFSIVGVDDLPYLDFLNPPLTSVRQPAKELGRRGVLALLGKYDGPMERLPVELVKRQSVAPPARP